MIWFQFKPCLMDGANIVKNTLLEQELKVIFWKNKNIACENETMLAVKIEFWEYNCPGEIFQQFG